MLALGKRPVRGNAILAPTVSTYGSARSFSTTRA
jgi:hypothetical protein